MSRITRIVNNKMKTFLPSALAALFVCVAGLSSGFAAEGGEEFPRPHLLYFYNPSCRLCTATNEVIDKIETQYKGRMSSQRFNIADEAEGMNNVLYMFDLMDAMQVPEEDETTLVVFVGLLEQDGEEVFFTPKRVLVEGEEIGEKLEGTVEEFLKSFGEGGVSMGSVLPTASFFLEHGAGRDSGS